MAEEIKEILLGELHPFPDHPFGVRDDEAMAQTVESIKEYGVLVPAIARPREDGGYEIIAGHRRKHACEIAGLKTMPVIVRDIDRNTERTSQGVQDEVRRYQTARSTARFNLYPGWTQVQRNKKHTESCRRSR